MCLCLQICLLIRFLVLFSHREVELRKRPSLGYLAEDHAFTLNPKPKKGTSC